MTITDDTLSDLTADTVAPLLRTELPGPVARAIIARDEAVTSPSLTRVYPLVVQRGRGCVLEDVDGNRFLDFNAGIAVVAAGHAHPAVSTRPSTPRSTTSCTTARATSTSPPTPTCASGWPPSPRCPTPRVFLCNSGTEAVEAALKLARHHTGRPNAIAFFGAFHGRSLGSLSLTASKSRQRAGFGIVTPGSFHAPYADPVRPATPSPVPPTSSRSCSSGSPTRATSRPSSSSRSRARAATSCLRAGWLADLRRLCDEHGILLVVDEVQTGIGRTGTMWASEHDGIEPDIMCIGKGLASGLPLAGIVAKAGVMDWAPGGHGSTFGGNPVACAAALATLDLVTAGLAANAAAVGRYLLDGLAALQVAQPLLEQVRGRGLDDRHRPPRPRHRRGRSSRRASGAACSC